MPRKKKILKTPEGVHDILPQNQAWRSFIGETVQDFARQYNFERIDTPIFEFTELFTKGIGVSTDIVEKQMYRFKSKGGDDLTLRPEGTAPIARAYIQHGMSSLTQPVKLYYIGPMFRYERPQKGRFRQFHQYGFEIIGDENAVLDAQLIQIFYRILVRLGLKNLTVQVNSIGCEHCRPYFKKILKNFYRSKSIQICRACKTRLKTNVLRVLDCKEEKCQRVRNQAPHIIDHLCEGCHNHFKEVLEFLDELEIPYNLNPYLVRGLDYYTKTVFEIWPQIKDKEVQSSQLALGGGGRYDNLIKLFSGKEVPAVGAAAGMERIISRLREAGVQPPPRPQVQIFLTQIGTLARRKSLSLLEDFHKAKISVGESLSRNSVRSQLNTASKLGAKYALILGQKEVLDGTIIIRDLESGGQEIVSLDKVIKEVKKRLKK